jgi:hypothetical protein
MLRTHVSQTAVLLLAALAGAEEQIALVPGWPADAPPGSKRLIFIRHAEGVLPHAAACCLA